MSAADPSFPEPTGEQPPASWTPPGSPSPPPPWSAPEPLSPEGYPGGSPAPPGYGYRAPAPRTDDKAVWALVSAITGYLLCPLVLHVVAWVLANQSLATIRASGGTVGGEGLAKTARILAIVGLVLYGVGVLFLVLFGILGLVAATTTGDLSPSTGVVNAAGATG